jgi:hypothetical protein
MHPYVDQSARCSGFWGPGRIFLLWDPNIFKFVGLRGLQRPQIWLALIML